MSATATVHRRATRFDEPFRSDAVLFLQAFAVAVMVFPSDTVIKAIGAAGYAAALVGIFIFGVYVASVVFGFHNPMRVSHPMQGVLAITWASVLVSYILMDRGRHTSIELLGADRVLIKYAVITGVVLVAAEWLRSLDDAMRVVRALCWGGAFCGLVAMLQFWAGFDLSHYLRQIPGFSVNHDNPAIVARGALNRVQGTAITAIELGVVMAMLIPLAACLGFYERGKSAFKRWGPLCLIIVGVATSVSRSAVVSVVVAFTVLVVLLPPVPRLAALAALPVALGGVFMSAHGLIGTLASFFGGASNDPSVLYRTYDYPIAEEMWQSAPWFGHGAGTYLPANSLLIFDNQYLGFAIELGIVGLFAFFIYAVFPGVIALAARRWAVDPDLRALCAALAAAALVTPVCSFTFDSMGFPMFVNIYTLVMGLVGCCVRLAVAQRDEARQTLPAPVLTPAHIAISRTTRLHPRSNVT